MDLLRKDGSAPVSIPGIAGVQYPDGNLEGDTHEIAVELTEDISPHYSQFIG